MAIYKELKLTIKQQAFVDYYIETLNATASYMRAFKNNNYNTSGVEAHRLLKNPKIISAIDLRLKQIDSKRIASAKDVLAFLTETMLDDDESMANRIKSAELIGKRHKLFTDKVEMNSSMDIEINLTGIDEEEDNYDDDDY